MAQVVAIAVAGLLGAYLIAGLCVASYIHFFRCPEWSKLPRNGMLWEARYHKRNTSWWILTLTGNHPIGLLLNIICWPFWLSSYLDAKEIEEAGEPRYHGPTTLEDDVPDHEKV